MASIKKVAKNKRGYSVAEVDSFLAIARDQYNQPEARILDWSTLGKKSFSIEKGGYLPSAVDQAIDKLEDTFASRELSSQSLDLTQLTALLLGRISRPVKKRFQRVGFFGFGYSIREVDALLTVVENFLSGEESLEVDELRELRFRVKRGGYREAQVDAFVDRLLELVQKKRFAKPYLPSPISSVDPGYGYPDPSHDPGY